MKARRLLIVDDKPGIRASLAVPAATPSEVKV